MCLSFLLVGIILPGIFREGKVYRITLVWKTMSTPKQEEP